MEETQDLNEILNDVQNETFSEIPTTLEIESPILESEKDINVFFTAIETPPQPTEALISAVETYQQIMEPVIEEETIVEEIVVEEPIVEEEVVSVSKKIEKGTHPKNW